MNYYPSGLQFCDGTTDSDKQPRRYNGKELDRMHGLNTYDYGARQYNPVTARWDRMDPLCEKYYSVSPYAYCGNNPMNRIDPDGRIIRDTNGQIVYVSSGYEKDFAHSSGSIACMEIGYIFTDNGQPIEVLKNIGKADKGWDTDCHGFTFADGKYWINNNQVENILKGDNYNIIDLEQAKCGDIVVYYKGNDVQHSVTIVNSDGTQVGTIVNGLGGMKTEAKETTLPNGWPIKGTLFEVYRKDQADRVASEEEITELKNNIHKYENNQ
jgi:RHS repeat-associated protein